MIYTSRQVYSNGYQVSITEQIELKISEALCPTRLEVKNVSHLHEGHAGHDGSGESHFNVLVVSDKFTGQTRVARQRMVYDLLGDEFKNGLHALSIKAFSPEEKSNR